MRVVAHAAIVWVGCFLCHRPELGLYLSPSVVPEPGRFERSGKVSGVGWASFGALGLCVSTVWTSSPVGWLSGLVVSAGPRGWALAAVVSLLVKGRTWTSLSHWVCVADCQPHFFMFWRQRGPWGVRHGEHRTLGFMCILLVVLAACFEGAACLTFGRPAVTSLIFTSGVCDKLGVMRTCPVAVWISWFSPGTEPCLGTQSYVS